jgi:hypothetical protein
MKPSVVVFWAAWGVDAVVTAVALWFFVAGLGDGSVSSFNAGIWLVLLAALAAVSGGSLWLRAAGRRGLALALALLLAVPGALAGLLLLVLLVAQPRWN